LTSGKSFKSILESFGPVDNNFFLDGEHQDAKLAAIVYSPVSGREMTVYTTEPCVQVYTGNM
jgi:aldose 1-epimerase